jgi:hypothetical protein
MTSTDTVNWTSQRSPADISWNGITYGVPSIGTYAGQGIFVGVADNGTSRVMTANFPNVYKNNSTAIGNGALTTGNNSMALGVGSASLGDNSVAYGVGASVTGNNSVAIGTGAKVISPFHLGDWKAYSPCTANRIVSITYGNGLFVAVLFEGTTPGKVITSPDGINWTFRQAVGAINWHTVVYGIPSTGTYAGQGLFVALSWGGTPGLMTSPDGINWTVRNTTNVDGKYFQVVLYGNGTFIGINQNSGSGAGTTNTFVYSRDGITWSISNINAIAAVNYWYASTYGNGYFLTIGLFATTPRLYRSADGITWSSGTLPIDASLNTMAFGNGVFVALSSNSNICMVSSNGLNWSVYLTPVIQYWQGMAFGNGLFVAVSATTSANVSIVSPDGINWTVKPTPYDYNWRGIAYGTVNGVGTFVSFNNNDRQTPNLMVASFEETQNSISIGQSAIVNGSGSIAIGANAKVSGYQLSSFINRITPIDNISVVLSDIENGVPSTGQYQGQTLFIAISSSITGGGVNNRIIISLDAVNWFPISVPADLLYTGIGYGIPSTGPYAGQGLFVGISSSNSSQQIITSPDGITWTLRTTPEFLSLQDIEFGNGTFVAVANGVASGASTNRVLISTDGISWTAKASTASTNTWNSIAFGNGTFIACADTTASGTQTPYGLMMYSTDNGNTWTGVSAPVYRPLVTITFGVPFIGAYANQGIFIHATSTGYVRYSLDGINWVTVNTPDLNPIYTTVTYGNGTFIAVSSNNYIAISTDALNWTYTYFIRPCISIVNGTPTIGPYANQPIFIIATSSTTGNKISTANFIDINVSTSVAIGNGAVATDNNQIVLGTTNDTVVVPGYFNVNSSIGIRGLYGGTVAAGFSTGTVNFGFSFVSVPSVVTQIISPSTNQVFSVIITDLSNTFFKYSKTYLFSTSNSGGTAPSEAFYYIAMCS